MDTDGDPGCLDYVWLRGAVRVDDGAAGLRPPAVGRSDALPERPPRHQRPARDRRGMSRARAPLRLAHRGDWRHGPENSLPALTAALAVPGLRRPRVRRPALGRRRPGPAPRRDPATASMGRPERPDAAAAPGPSRSSASRPWPTSSPRSPRRAFLDVELKGDVGPAVVEVLAAGRGPDLDRAVVSSFEPADARAGRPR